MIFFVVSEGKSLMYLDLVCSALTEKTEMGFKKEESFPRKLMSCLKLSSCGFQKN